LVPIYLTEWFPINQFGGSSQTRTGDTRLFRPLLYQLS
jgi:hypothetical protein